ncbi:hypothetical protein L7F22_047644 [Adiantum nelumboides]|nr:hypothetical protein [Adiantum nelumboides]
MCSRTMEGQQRLEKVPGTHEYSGDLEGCRLQKNLGIQENDTRDTSGSLRGDLELLKNIGVQEEEANRISPDNLKYDQTLERDAKTPKFQKQRKIPKETTDPQELSRKREPIMTRARNQRLKNVVVAAVQPERFWGHTRRPTFKIDSFYTIALIIIRLIVIEPWVLASMAAKEEGLWLNSGRSIFAIAIAIAAVSASWLQLFRRWFI